MWVSIGVVTMTAAQLFCDPFIIFLNVQSDCYLLDSLREGQYLFVLDI